MDYIERQTEVITRTLLFWCLFFVREVLSDACTYKRGTITSYVYCEHGCCGTETNRKCCAYEISTSVLVVACVVSGLVVLALIAAVIICCYKNYKDKQQSRVRALRQEQQRNAPVRPAEPRKPPSYIEAPPQYSEEMPESHYRPQTAMHNNQGNVSYNTRFGGVSRVGSSRTENAHPLGTVPANMARASGSYNRNSTNSTQLPGAIDDAPPRYSSLDRGQTPIANTSNTANTNHRRFIRTPDPNDRNNSAIIEEELNSRTETESTVTHDTSSVTESQADTRAGRSASRIPQRIRNLQSQQSTAPRSRMTTRSSGNVGNNRNTTLSEMDDSDISSLGNI